jgi:hypothetical protein
MRTRGRALPFAAAIAAAILALVAALALATWAFFRFGPAPEAQELER